MIDFHTHTLMSDGVLLPSELARRASVIGYEAMAVTDHVDASNIKAVLDNILLFCDSFDSSDITVVPGVELTHIPPDQMGDMIARARELGAKIVVCHGETVVEPVRCGTNRASIEGGADILAHPGLVTEEDARLAAETGVHFEITARKGHSITNGHVASVAKRFGVKMVLNTDAHAPSDLITDEFARLVALGAGLLDEDLRIIDDNARKLLCKATT